MCMKAMARTRHVRSEFAPPVRRFVSCGLSERLPCSRVSRKRIIRIPDPLTADWHELAPQKAQQKNDEALRVKAVARHDSRDRRGAGDGFLRTRCPIGLAAKGIFVVPTSIFVCAPLLRERF